MDILVELKFEEKSGSLQSQCMKGFGVTHVISATINHCTWKILHFICRHPMTIFAICVISVTLKLHAREILKYLGTLFIRVFNIYELIVDIQVQQRTTLTDICNQCIKKHEAKPEKDPKVNDAIHDKVYFTCESCDYKTAYNGDLKNTYAVNT